MPILEFTKKKELPPEERLQILAREKAQYARSNQNIMQDPKARRAFNEELRGLSYTYPNFKTLYKKEVLNNKTAG